MLRILQESLQNIRKHAGPDVSVSLEIEIGEQEIMMNVSDNGIGFDQLLVAPKVTGGEGIIGMRDRAASVHGRLSLESRAGAGSTVSFVLPFIAGQSATQTRPNESS